MLNLVKPIISIIMPIYNVEPYLREAVDSVLSQSFQDYELILVDDGSTDKSPTICDEYAKLDQRITVLHKENGGLSDARNHGIRAAVGQYLLFLDGDDFIAEDSLIHLVNTIKQEGEVDVILLNVAHYYGEGMINYNVGYFDKSKLYHKSQKEALSFLTSMSDFTTSACLKLMKRDLIISKKIFFRPVVWCEDTDFSIKLYLSAKTYNYCESYLYYYRKEREGSLTYTFSEHKFKDLLQTTEKWVKEAKENPNYIQFKADIYRYFAFQYCLLLSGYHKIGRLAQQRWKEKMKEYSWLLKMTSHKKVYFVRLFYQLLGLRCTSKALSLYEKINCKRMKSN